MEQAVAECTRELKHELAVLTRDWRLNWKNTQRNRRIIPGGQCGLREPDQFAAVGRAGDGADDEGKAEEPSALRLTTEPSPGNLLQHRYGLYGREPDLHSLQLPQQLRQQEALAAGEMLLLAACHGRTAYSVLTDYPEWEFNPDSRLARLICRGVPGADGGAPAGGTLPRGQRSAAHSGKRLPGRISCAWGRRSTTPTRPGNGWASM